jgi:hypothetical protein
MAITMVKEMIKTTLETALTSLLPFQQSKGTSIPPGRLLLGSLQRVKNIIFDMMRLRLPKVLCHLRVRINFMRF